MKSTILLTGGTGFIGSHLLPALIHHNYKVILLKRKESSVAHLQQYLSKLTIYTTDGNLERIFTTHKIDSVIHLSSMYIKHETGLAEIEEMNEVNINLPSRITYLAAKYGVQHFINTGTFFEYAPTKKKISEDSPRIPFNYYTATKMAFEDILRYYSTHSNLRSLTLRLFSPYGEREKSKIVSLLIRSFVKRESIKVTAGTQRLSFTYAGDIANAYIKALRFLKSSYRHYETFNIGSDKTYSIKEIALLLENISGEKNLVEFGALPLKKNEILVSRCDPTKARTHLEWTADTGISDGLKRTYFAAKNAV